MDHKDVLRRFIAGTEAKTIRRKRMPFTGSVMTGLMYVALAIAIAFAIVSIYNLVTG